MRKKIKEIMNKEEGFTLVELLAVIVILGIILAIAVPAIGNVIDKAGTDADDAEVELVKDAARLYFTAEEDAKATTVSVADLESTGYLESNKTKLTGNVTRSKDASGKYKYDSSGLTRSGKSAEVDPG